MSLFRRIRNVDLDAAIEPAAGLGGVVADGAGLADADGLQASRRDAAGLQGLLDRIGTGLGQGEIGLLTTGGIGMALDAGGQSSGSRSSGGPRGRGWRGRPWARWLC